MRAAVFDVMHEQGELKRNPNAPQLKDFPQESAAAMEIVMEFLAFFQFEHALQVLQTEANRTAPASDRVIESIRAKLGLSPSALRGKSQRPVLLQMLERLLQSGDPYEVKSSLRSDAKIDFVLDKETVSPATVESRAKEIGLSRSGERAQDNDEWKPMASRQEMEAPRCMATEEDHEPRDTAAEESEEILSGSEIDESVIEEQSASGNYSQDYSTSDFAALEKDPVAVEVRKQDDEHEDHDEDQSEASEDESATLPPPVPSKLLAFNAEREMERMLPPATSTTTDLFDDEDSDAVRLRGE